MKASSNLEQVFAKGLFAVTAELGPKQGVDVEDVRHKAGLLKDYCDAMNITDNQTAVVRMSSIGAGIIVRQMNLDPVIQIVCRDRNRLAIQADVLGASAHGIINVLALTGDHQTMGNHPQAKNVHDLDSLQLLQCLKGLREGKFMNGDPLKTDPPPLFIGAAANPFGGPLEFRVARLAKKVKAGAQFIQTQPVFAMDIFKNYMEDARARGLHEQTHILAGIIPMKSAGMAKYMRDNVAGVIVPDEKVNRMINSIKGIEDKEEKKKRQAEEGVKIACEEIEQVREMKGVHGIHIMAVAWEEIVPDVVTKAGLKERPKRLPDS